MDNPEKQDTGQRQTMQQQQKTQHRKLKLWATRTPPKNRGWRYPHLTTWNNEYTIDFLNENLIRSSLFIVAGPELFTSIN
jgi:hypothetical protein